MNETPVEQLNRKNSELFASRSSESSSSPTPRRHKDHKERESEKSPNPRTRRALSPTRSSERPLSPSRSSNDRALSPSRNSPYDIGPSALDFETNLLITKEMVLNSIVLLQNKFNFDISSVRLSQKMVKILLDITASGFGLIADVKYEDGKAYKMKVSLVIRNKKRRDVYKIPYKLNQIKGTFLDDVFSRKHIIISNDMTNFDSKLLDLSDRIDQPKVESILAVPITDPKQNVLAVVALFNRPLGYSNWRRIEPLLEYYKILIMALKLHTENKELKNPSITKNFRDRFKARKEENDITYVSNPLMNLKKINKPEKSPSSSFSSSEEGRPTYSKSPSFDILIDNVKTKDKINLAKLLKVKKFQEYFNQTDDVLGQNIIHIAVQENDPDVLKMLLEALVKMDPQIINEKDTKHGNTPLHLAAQKGDPMLMTILLSVPEIEADVRNFHGASPFHYFCHYFATPSSLRNIFEHFLSRKVDINGIDNINGETPLHKAVLNPSVKLLLVRLLIEHHVDVNICNAKGNTALHYAVKMNRKDLIEELLIASADIRILNQEKNTPQDDAIFHKCDSEIKVLLQNAHELLDWLNKFSEPLSQYLPLFIREKIYKDTLHLIVEQNLIDMGIVQLGQRMKILNSCQEIAKKRANSNLAGSQGGGGSRATKIAIGPRRKNRSEIRMPQLMMEAGTLETSEDEENKRKSDEITTVTTHWIAYSQLEFTKQMNQGSTGQVFLGLYCGGIVAIKSLEKRKNEQELDLFKHEFKILNSISAHGPNVVSFFGACLEPSPYLVMEFCSRGSLYDCLVDTNLHFGWKEMIGFFIQMTRGVQCLHKAKILHRDIKSKNFLVTENWTIKVADFGEARGINTVNKDTFRNFRGTPLYVAPESCKGLEYTAQSDIYSLGLCGWEMTYRCINGKYQIPFAEYAIEAMNIVLQTPNGLRPSIPGHCPNEMATIITACWANDPAKRPNSDRLLSQLLDLFKKVISDIETIKPTIWIDTEYQESPPTGTSLTKLFDSGH